MSVPIRWLLVAALLFIGIARAEEAKPAFRIYEFSGDAATIGKAHGQALGEEIRLLDEQYLRRFLLNETLRRIALGNAEEFRKKLSPEHQMEIAALADGGKVDAGVAMLANCFLDLMPMVACSTITLPAEASPDGVARFGRNLDFPSLGIADKHSLVFIVKPQGKYAFASVGWPGMIGTLSGMNEHGLCLANMEVTRPISAPRAMPYTILYRTILETCKTVDEAIALLEKTPRQTANNLMLMDASGGRAVVEITQEKITVRRADAKSALISTNHHRGEDLTTGGRCRRYDTLRRQSGEQFGKIGVMEVEKMLDAVNQKKLTLQSMVFEPKNRVMYLAVGSEATKREYRKIELGEHFQPGPKKG